MAQETESIQISREEFNRAAALFDLMQAARENREARSAFAAVASYSNRKPRAFVRPEAAVALRKVLGDSGARALLGNHAHRDFAQFAQQPTPSDVHVDAVLTNLSVAYRNEEYIGPLAVPRVQVVKRSDKYFKYGKENLRRQATVRAPGGPTPRSGYTPSTDNYSVDNYIQGHAIPDEVRKNSDSPLDADRDGINFCTDILDLEYEMQVAELLNTSANWTTNATLAGTSRWNDYSNSAPFTDVQTGRLTILPQCTKRANTMMQGYQVFETLSLHPDLLERCKYTGSNTQPAMVTASMMASLFMLEQLLVGAAIKNSAKEGQSDSLDYVFGKHAWLGYVASQPGLMRPSAAYVFTIGRLADGFRDEDCKSDVVRVEEDWDMKVVDPGAGYRIVTAID